MYVFGINLILGFIVYAVVKTICFISDYFAGVKLGDIRVDDALKKIISYLLKELSSTDNIVSVIRGILFGF